MDLRSYDHRKTIDSIAEYYNNLSWFVIPLKYGTKQPLEDSWNEKPLDFDLLKQYAQGPINLGILLGKRVIDIDLDCPESRSLAPYILPETAIFGRESTPGSHFVYTLSSDFDSEGVNIKQWRMPKSLVDEDKAMVLELRGLTKSNKYSQTMFPPSVHPSGEYVKWETGDVVPTIIDSEGDMDSLTKNLRLLAMSSILLKCWDKGVRDDLAISFTATLLKSDYHPNIIIDTLRGIMIEAHDDEMEQRINSSVKGTIRRFEEEEAIAGLSKMREILTDDVYQFIRKNAGVHNDDIPGLVYTAKGAISKTTENLSLIIHHDPQLRNLLAVDTITEGVVYVGGLPEVERFGFTAPKIGDEYEDGHAYMIAVHVANKYGTSFGPDRVEKVMIDMALTNNKVNFLADKIKQCKWDGEERIPFLFQNIFGVTGSEYSLMAKAWFRTAVQRVFEPGCPMNHMLILRGNQGCGKSAFTNIISFDNPEWHSDFSGSLDNTEAHRIACSKWIIELSELSSFRSTKDHNSLKSFITRMSDDYRMLYKNKVMSHPRTCVFIGTTNDDNFLTDTTGNRRYWIVDINSNYNQNNTIDLEWLIKNREQIWGEAYHSYKTVPDSDMRRKLQSINFTDKVEETHGMFAQDNKFMEEEGALQFIVDKFKERNISRGKNKEFISTMDFCCGKMGMDKGAVKSWDMNNAADVFKSYKLKKVRRKIDGKLMNVFVPTPEFWELEQESIEEGEINVELPEEEY